MVVSLFGLVLVSAALTRLIVLHPLPLAVGLMAGHAALVADAGPVETFGAFALAVTGVSGSCRPPCCARMAIRPCWIFDWAQGLGAGLLHGTKNCSGSQGHNWFCCNRSASRQLHHDPLRPHHGRRLYHSGDDTGGGFWAESDGRGVTHLPSTTVSQYHSITVSQYHRPWPISL